MNIRVTDIFRSFLTILMMTGVALAQTGPGVVPVGDLLKANSHEITLSNGALSGDGAEFLIKASERSQFFAIGEPHDTKEVPEITSLLFKLLKARHRFNYLALEQDPVMMQMLSRSPMSGNQGGPNNYSSPSSAKPGPDAGF